jgi:transcriptional regulator with PAS, ATPase and Fis domain
MRRSSVLLIDACGSTPCEHFEGVRRWLSVSLPGTQSIRDPRIRLDPAETDAPDVVVVHLPEESMAGAVQAKIARAFPHAMALVAAHGKGQPGHTCISEATIDALHRGLPDLGARQPFQVLPGVVGCSTSVCEAAEQVRLMAGSEAVCLLQGETGTGKELFARAIHYLGERKHRPFVPVNCGAIQDSLFENELFGHVRGAYTDARNERHGLLAHAESGTIFLDEVDCLSASAQVKLLRVLQEREYRPVGSTHSLKADVRIIAATNTDLRRRVQQQVFREDLFHRLNVLRLFIPPLRERHADHALLVRTFLRDFARRYKRDTPALTDDAYLAVEQYDWPGNVREMQAVLERAVLLARGGMIAAADLELPCGPAPDARGGGMKHAKARAIQTFERGYLQEVLSRCAGNISLAARIARKERRSFQRLLRKHNLTGAEFRVLPPVTIG